MYHIAELLQDYDNFIFCQKADWQDLLFKIPNHVQHTVIYEYDGYVSKKADCGMLKALYFFMKRWPFARFQRFAQPKN